MLVHLKIYHFKMNKLGFWARNLVQVFEYAILGKAVQD